MWELLKCHRFQAHELTDRSLSEKKEVYRHVRIKSPTYTFRRKRILKFTNVQGVLNKPYQHCTDILSEHFIYKSALLYTPWSNFTLPLRLHAAEVIDGFEVSAKGAITVQALNE